MSEIWQKIGHWYSYKVLAILVRFWWNLNFHDGFPENTQIRKFMKIRSVGGRDFSIRTDMAKLLAAFRNFGKARWKFLCDIFQILSGILQRATVRTVLGKVRGCDETETNLNKHWHSPSDRKFCTRGLPTSVYRPAESLQADHSQLLQCTVPLFCWHGHTLNPTGPTRRVVLGRTQWKVASVLQLLHMQAI